MSRWERLWKAVKEWWRNDTPPFPNFGVLIHARELIYDYNKLYCQRTKISIPGHSWQAASIVEREGHQRSPSLESEIRVLALTLEKVISYLEERREDEIRRLQSPRPW